MADLKKWLAPELQAPFAEAIRVRLATGTLPPRIGCLRIKKVPYLFRREAVLWGRGTEEAAAEPEPARPTEVVPVPQGPPSDFAARFDEAFARLDRQRGGHNLVGLVLLRRELGLERSDFDSGLQELRRAGRYSLSSAEGRHGLSDDERAAGIVEEESLLLYVSRRG
jgi:hypothetical protein